MAKKGLFLISFFLLIFFIAYFSLQIFLRLSKPLIEQILSKQLRLDTRFHSAFFKLPNTLLFKKAIIQRDDVLLLACEEIEIKLSLLKFLTSLHPYSLIKLIKPTIFVEEMFSVTKPHLQLAQPRAFEVCDATLISSQFKVSNISGKINLQLPKVEANLSGKDMVIKSAMMLTEDVRDIDVSFSRKEKTELKMKLTIQNETQEFNFEGAFKHEPLETYIKGCGKVHSFYPLDFFSTVNLNAEIFGQPMDVSGKISLSAGEIRFTDFKLIYAGRTADVTAFYKDKRFNINITTDKREINLYYCYPHLSVISAEERLDIDLLPQLTFKGKIFGYATSGLITSSNGVYSGEFKAAWQDSVLAGEFKVEKEQIEAKLNISKLKIAKAVNLNCSTNVFLKVIPRKLVDGTLNISDIKVGDIDIPMIKALISFKDDKIAIREISSPNLSGNVVIDVRDNKIAGDIMSEFELKPKGRFNGNFRIKGKILSPDITFNYTLSNFYYNGFRTSISGEGKFRGDALMFSYDGILHGDFVNTKLQGKAVLHRRKELIVTSNFKLRDFYFKQTKLGEICGEIIKRGKVLSVKNLKISSKDGIITSDASFDFGKAFFESEINVHNFSIRPVTFQGDIRMKCRKIKRDVDKFDGEVQLTNFWINQYNIKAQNIKFSFYKERLKLEDKSGSLTASILFKKDGADYKLSMLNVKSEGTLKKGNIDILATGSKADVGDIISLLNIKYPIDGKTDFTIKATGPLQDIQTSANFSITDLSIHELKFDKSKFNFKISDKMIKISKLTFEKPGFKALISGEYPLYLYSLSHVRGKPISIKIKAEKASLSLLKDFIDEITHIDGTTSFDISIEGKYPKHLYKGIAKFEARRMEMKEYFDEVKDLFGEMKFSNDKVLLAASAKTKGRLIKIDGYALVDKLFVIKDYRIDVQAPKGLPLKMRSMSLGSLSISRDERLSRDLRCDLKINQLQIKKEQEKNIILADIAISNSSFLISPVEKRKKMIKDLIFDVKLKIDKNMWYESQLARLRLTGDIHVKSVEDKTVANGMLTSKGGTINYFGNVFDVKHFLAEIKENKVYLELVAEANLIYEGEMQMIRLVVEKTSIDKISPKFLTAAGKIIEKPEKIFSEAMGLKEDMAPHERSIILRQQLIKLIDHSLTTAFARSILQEMGLVDDIKATHTVPEPAGGVLFEPSLIDLLKGTKYTFEKYITDDVIISYSIMLTELRRRLALKHEIEIAYRLKGNVYIKGTYGLPHAELTERPERKIGVEYHWRFGW